MASRLEIWNRAISNIGGRILEFDPTDGTVQQQVESISRGEFNPVDLEQRTIATLYPSVRDGLLAEAVWSFNAQSHVLEDRSAPQPSTNLDNPDNDPDTYRNSWPLLDGQTAMYRLNDPAGVTGYMPKVTDAAGNTNLPWVRERGYVYTNFMPVHVKYTVAVVEEVWPFQFTKAVEYELSARLAIPVMEDQDLFRYWNQLAKDQLEKAKRVDGQSNPATTWPSYRMVNARFSGYGGRGRR